MKSTLLELIPKAYKAAEIAEMAGTNVELKPEELFSILNSIYEQAKLLRQMRKELEQTTILLAAWEAAELIKKGENEENGNVH